MSLQSELPNPRIPTAAVGPECELVEKLLHPSAWSVPSGFVAVHTSLPPFDAAAPCSSSPMPFWRVSARQRASNRRRRRCRRGRRVPVARWMEAHARAARIVGDPRHPRAAEHRAGGNLLARGVCPGVPTEVAQKSAARHEDATSCDADAVRTNRVGTARRDRARRRFVRSVRRGRCVEARVDVRVHPARIVARAVGGRGATLRRRVSLLCVRCAAVAEADRRIDVAVVDVALRIAHGAGREDRDYERPHPDTTAHLAK